MLAHVAPLVAPAVDLTVLGLLVGTCQLAVVGVDDLVLRLGLPRSVDPGLEDVLLTGRMSNFPKAFRRCYRSFFGVVTRWRGARELFELASSGALIPRGQRVQPRAHAL